MKILITTYYGLKESLICADKALREAGFETTEYPLFRFYNDAHDRRDDYVEHFIEDIRKNDPDIILWWYIGIPTSDMEQIVKANPKIKNIFFNWDEPLNWEPCDLQNKAKLLDQVFVCCAEKLDDYRRFGTEEAHLLFPGYDPNIHNMILDENPNDVEQFGCDISIVCTNLYENPGQFPNQYVNRKELVDNIYKNRLKYGYTFHIYGPEKFRDMYPDSYKGYIPYEDTNKVFNYSKINICTHVHNNRYKYLNERTLMILGSGGLLFVDSISGLDELLIPDKECIVIDKDRYVEQIVDIVDNYDDYYIIRHRGYKKGKQYTWRAWAEFIKSKITV